MMSTDLKLEFVGKGDLIPPFSARECHQTLTTIPQDVMRRTVNGDLVCVNKGGHKKFLSTIKCKDKAPPAFDGLWKGMILKVGCVQSVTQHVNTGTLSVQMDREGFDHHLFGYRGGAWPTTPSQNRWMSISPGFPGGFMTYKPILLMMVKTYVLETDEWGLSVGWTLDLEEI
jgi:hypothetical protein